MDEDEQFNVSAPWSWNARHFVERGCPRTGGAEFLLYSDTRVAGDLEVTCHPYVITNCLGIPQSGRLAPVLALYLDDHFPKFDVQPMDKTDTDGWLNLTLDDEIACLFSLVAGMRLRSGGRVRNFKEGLPEERPSSTATTPLTGQRLSDPSIPRPSKSAWNPWTAGWIDTSRWGAAMPSRSSALLASIETLCGWQTPTQSLPGSF